MIAAPARRGIGRPLGHNEGERVKFNPVLLCRCRKIKGRPQRGVHVRRKHLHRPAIGLARRKRRRRDRGFIENNRRAIELPACGQLGRRAFGGELDGRLFARRQIAILPTRRRSPQHDAFAFFLSLLICGRHAPVPNFLNRMPQIKLQPPIINRPARLISNRDAPGEPRFPSIHRSEAHEHLARRGGYGHANGEE